ncbi:hypothetical protein [Neisseria animalis]|nr:hypothetical protein [Neisseria animalis]VEE07323.1 Uncharacterised protein [Neisseria animalis]
MARISGETIIQQKIMELNHQIMHFEECIKQAKEYQATLRQALVALRAEPFSTPMKQVIKQKREKVSNRPVDISLYSRRSSEFIAKVFKHYPNQWMSANEMMWKAFEIEGKTEHKSYHHSIVTAFSHALRRLKEKGIVERQELREKPSVKVIRWRLKEIGM